MLKKDELLNPKSCRFAPPEPPECECCCTANGFPAHLYEAVSDKRDNEVQHGKNLNPLLTNLNQRPSAVQTP